MSLLAVSSLSIAFAKEREREFLFSFLNNRTCFIHCTPHVSKYEYPTQSPGDFPSVPIHKMYEAGTMKLFRAECHLIISLLADRFQNFCLVLSEKKRNSQTKPPLARNFVSLVIYIYE